MMLATLNSSNHALSCDREKQKCTFPYRSLLLSVLFICLAPFTTPYLIFVAFAINLYRLFFLDLSFFFVDVACLVCYANIYRLPGGTSLFSVLLLVAVLAFLVRRGARGNALFGCALVVVVLLAIRMQGDFVNFIWIVGSVLIAYFLALNMTAGIAKQTVLSYCVSIVISSAYALLLRNFPVYQEYTRGDAQAIFGEEAIRFKGLFADANYYAVFLVLALALLMQLYFSKSIKTNAFSALSVATVIFGLMTYGKTFFLIFVLLLCFLVVFLFVKRKWMFGFLSVVLITAMTALVLSGKVEIFNVVLSRFTEADNLNEMTTGRLDSWMAYLKCIFADVRHMFFGYGLRAPLVNKLGTHNLYLEISYYLGLIGFTAFVVFAVLIYRQILPNSARQRGLSQFVLQNLSLWVFLGFYLSLQGMFTSSAFVQYILAVAGGSLVWKNNKNKCE